MENLDKKIVCIVGMHRSGSSMVARLLNLCGLDLGPSDRLVKATDANPLGHFEHRGFLEIDRKLLKIFNGTWNNPPELAPLWFEEPRLAPLYDEAKILVSSFPTELPWGWKEPRATLFLPFWKKVIPGMRFLVCIRDPLEVACSLTRRNGFTVEEGAALWYRYTLQALGDTEGCPRRIVFFDDLFETPRQEVDRIIEFCGLERSPDDNVEQRAIAPELRNHRRDLESVMNESAIDTDCKLLYFYLRRMLAGDFVAKNGDAAATDELLATYVRILQGRRTDSIRDNVSTPSNFSAIEPSGKRFTVGWRKLRAIIKQSGNSGLVLSVSTPGGA